MTADRPSTADPTPQPTPRPPAPSPSEGVPPLTAAAHGEAPAVPPRGLRHAARALKHRDFTIFWAGALVSNTGSWVQNLTVPFVLYELTHSATLVGLATFTQF